jgi:hypothetical protein
MIDFDPVWGEIAMREGPARSQVRGDGKVLGLTAVIHASVQGHTAQDDRIAVNQSTQLIALAEDPEVTLEVAYGVGVGRGVKRDIGDKPGIPQVACDAEAQTKQIVCEFRGRCLEQFRVPHKRNASPRRLDPCPLDPRLTQYSCGGPPRFCQQVVKLLSPNRVDHWHFQHRTAPTSSRSSR